MWGLLKRSGRYGKFLYTCTLVCVILFQASWLWQNYLEARQSILKQAELVIKQELVKLSIQKLSGPGESDLLWSSGLTDTNSTHNGSHPRPTVIIKEIDDENPAKEIQEVAAMLALQMKHTSADDSLIYSAIISQVPALRDTKSLTIYRQSAGKRYTFPRNRPFDLSNATLPVSASVDKDTVIWAGIGNLPVVIFKKIAGILCISLLYLALFLVTLVVLVQTISAGNDLLEKKNNFARNITHELKTPLTTLSVATEALMKYSLNDPSEEARKYLSSIRYATKQLSDTLDVMVTNAVQQHRIQVPRKELFLLRPFLGEILNSMQLQLERKAAHIDLQSIDEEEVLYADKWMMKHVFLNLIDNSLKYSSRVPVIRISSHFHLNRLVILFSDNGNGIPSKHVEDVFEPYFRAVNPDVHDVKGFGLGLSFVKEVMRIQGGQVAVQSSGPEGTTISLTLAASEA